MNRPKIKSAPSVSAQDASAALPRNCQTTSWIVGAAPIGVNVTLVTRLFLAVTSKMVAEVRCG
jgi:hypothetical protein